MCGRYASFLPAEAIARLFHTVNPIPQPAPVSAAAPSRSRGSAAIDTITQDSLASLNRPIALTLFADEPPQNQSPIEPHQ
jgi:hypothetical protein